jgi:hypothetical protein
MKNFLKIQRIVIGHEGLGKINDWYLKSIKVQMLAQQEEFVLIIFIKQESSLCLDMLLING